MATTSYYHYDALGSTERLTNSSQTTTDTYNYPPFGGDGNPDKHSTTTNPYRYVGRLGYQVDGPATSDGGNPPIYVRARGYDYNVARWLSQDPIGVLWELRLAEQLVQFGRNASLHAFQYTYAKNNPSSVMDPSGWIDIVPVIPMTPSGPPPLSKRVYPCPCTKDELLAIGGLQKITLRKCDDNTIREYHPGAANCWRLCDMARSTQAGNQCCYDDSGALITGGPGAGTPDLFSVACNINLAPSHLTHDVGPFKDFKRKYGSDFGWCIYHQAGWAPVYQPRCKKNELNHGICCGQNLGPGGMPNPVEPPPLPPPPPPNPVPYYPMFPIGPIIF